MLDIFREAGVALGGIIAGVIVVGGFFSPVLFIAFVTYVILKNNQNFKEIDIL